MWFRGSCRIQTSAAGRGYFFCSSWWAKHIDSEHHPSFQTSRQPTMTVTSWLSGLAKAGRQMVHTLWKDQQPKENNDDAKETRSMPSESVVDDDKGDTPNTTKAGEKRDMEAPAEGERQQKKPKCTPKLSPISEKLARCRAASPYLSLPLSVRAKIVS